MENGVQINPATKDIIIHSAAFSEALRDPYMSPRMYSGLTREAYIMAMTPVGMQQHMVERMAHAR